MRRALTRRPQAHQPGADFDRLPVEVLRIADALGHLLDQAAQRHLAIPRSVSNSIHDLRGWAARIDHASAPEPLAVDAARLLAYLRGLPNQQLLAVVADLPWARLDALLDAATTRPPPPRSP